MSLQSSGLSLGGSANIEDIIASEKEVWSKEKLTLQKSLKRAEAKRLYGKYLRAESFRKALMFQKKYLLLLLGRFQECEEATMALLETLASQGVKQAHSSALCPDRRVTYCIWHIICNSLPKYGRCQSTVDILRIQIFIFTIEKQCSRITPQKDTKHTRQYRE
ncbi:hypothetical protein A6R68_17753 [Neotoma lepida]|uniref:Pericentrin/AKAP-450 centrosomal targeting domain-containing protein n=1 Tax=Neotoma lepida TaxID=56216 RepID=A0A1A6HB46_NEOLE|nr:hypothetical protein A6R68_17753 [Neotoma lepida]